MGGRAAALGSGPRGGRSHLLSMGPPAPLLGRTPEAVRARLNLHVHGTDVARLVLSDPQLPVFGWVHFSKQLVHRLDCLQGTEKGTQVRAGGCARDNGGPCEGQPCAGLQERGAPGSQPHSAQGTPSPARGRLLCLSPPLPSQNRANGTLALGTLDVSGLFIFW